MVSDDAHLAVYHTNLGLRRIAVEQSMSVCHNVWVLWRPIKSSNQQLWKGTVKSSRTIFVSQNSWSWSQHVYGRCAIDYTLFEKLAWKCGLYMLIHLSQIQHTFLSRYSNFVQPITTEAQQIITAALHATCTSYLIAWTLTYVLIPVRIVGSHSLMYSWLHESCYARQVAFPFHRLGDSPGCHGVKCTVAKITRPFSPWRHVYAEVWLLLRGSYLWGTRF